jgi:hypothetical protein
MSLSTRAIEFRRLRESPAWRLLAATNGPQTLAILAERFGEGGRVAASALREFVRRDLEDLRSQGEALVNQAPQYIAQWVYAGLLERRFLPGESEESYELSLDAAQAIRLVEGLSRPRQAATESRLATVVTLVERLEEETDPNPASRIATLEAERERIEKRIDELRSDSLASMDTQRALERAREIVALAGELSDDFIRVGAEFEKLNRELRHSLVEGEMNRGSGLGQVFTGIDHIAQTEAGRAFEGFFRLLMNPGSRESLETSLESILARDFSGRLSMEEREFLAGFTDILLDRGGRVRETQVRLARSLRDFLQSREYLEKRRIAGPLAEAERAALSLHEDIKPFAELGIRLDRTSARLRSIGQWRLYDPAMAWSPSPMLEAQDSEVDPGELAARFLAAEIDYRALKEWIRSLLQTRDQVSVGDVLCAYPAEQGLGSLVGLVDLAFRYGHIADSTEAVSWITKGEERHATIPLAYFLKESIDELA